MGAVSRLDFEKAVIIRRLHAEGKSHRQLAPIFNCAHSLIGLVCRNAIWQQKPCNGCHAMIPTRRTSGLCEACKAQFCDRCNGPKPATRLSTRCVTCDREKRKLHFERHPGVCSRCAEVFPEKRRDYLCYECRRDEDDFYRTFKQKRAKEQGIVCKTEGCENLIPTAKGWSRITCRECTNKIERLRRALSRRQCGLCGKRLKDEEIGLCVPCRRDDQRIRYRANRDRQLMQAEPCD